MRKSKPRMPSVKCPACGKDSFARNMGITTLTYRELYYLCRDEIQCGHAFVVSMEAKHTVRASIVAEPLRRLPLTTWRPAANDRAANDDDIPPNEPAADAVSG